MCISFRAHCLLQHCGVLVFGTSVMCMLLISYMKTKLNHFPALIYICSLHYSWSEMILSSAPASLAIIFSLIHFSHHDEFVGNLRVFGILPYVSA